MTRTIQEPTLELEARRQFGAFHIEQAKAHGYSDARLYRLRRAGVIRRALPAVCTFTSAPDSPLQRDMVALLWAGPEAALAKRSSARHHQLDVKAGSRIELMTTRHLRSPNGQIVVYRRDCLPRDHLAISGPYVLTSIERTLFDLAWDLNPESFDAALDSALSQWKTTHERLWALWMAYHECGRNGSVRFREHLERRSPGERPPTNRNERRLLDLIARAGLPQPLCQVPLYDGPRFVARPDFVWPANRLAVEAQSRLAHGTISQRIADDRRAARLDALGWRVVRVWWEEVQDDPDAVVERIRGSLSVPVVAPSAS